MRITQRKTDSGALNARLQEHASSQEHGTGHDAGRVALADGDGSVLGGALRSHSGGAGLARRGRSGHGQSFGGRSGGGDGRRRGHGSGVLASTLSSLLACLLTFGVVGVSVDALAVGGLADIEWDGLDVLAGVGSGTVTALALKLQGGLRLEVLVGFNGSDVRNTYRIAGVGLGRALAHIRADVALALAP